MTTDQNEQKGAEEATVKSPSRAEDVYTLIVSTVAFALSLVIASAAYWSDRPGFMLVATLGLCLSGTIGCKAANRLGH